MDSFVFKKSRKQQWGVLVNHYSSWAIAKNKQRGIKTRGRPFNRIGGTASVVSAVSGSAANWGTITIKISRYGYDTPDVGKSFTGQGYRRFGIGPAA